MSKSQLWVHIAEQAKAPWLLLTLADAASARQQLSSGKTTLAESRGRAGLIGRQQQRREEARQGATASPGGRLDGVRFLISEIEQEPGSRGLV
jgi:hypothetical protein